MRKTFVLSLLFSIIAVLSPFSFAQDVSAPGSQVRSQLLGAIEGGSTLKQAANDVSENVLSEGLYFEPLGLVYLGENQPSYLSLVELLNDNATGFELAIAGFNELPDQASQVVTIAILMFPDAAEEIYNIALQMQVISEDDALLALINAGIDPSTIAATAAGGIANSASPLGVGTGAAGAGGGDTTVSTN